MPCQQWGSHRAGNFLGQYGFAGSGLTLDQKRALQSNGRIDRNRQITRGDISVSAFKTHGGCPISRK